MANTVLTGMPDAPGISFDEVANFPAREELFPIEMPFFTRAVPDAKGELLGMVKLYANMIPDSNLPTHGNKMLMLLYVPEYDEMSPEDVSALGTSLQQMAKEVRDSFPELSIDNGALHLLEFIMPRVIQVNILTIGGVLKNLQLNQINGETIPVFNEEVSFGDPFSTMSIMGLSRMSGAGFFKGIKAGQDGFEAKLRVRRRDLRVKGETFVES